MLETDTEFYKGLNFLPLINQHADTHTSVHERVKYCCFLMPTTSDPDRSKSSVYGCQPKLSGRLHGNEDAKIKQILTRWCTLFLYTPVNCITNIKGCSPNLNSCKNLQGIEYNFVFLFPFVLFSLPFLCVNVWPFFLYSSVSQGKGQEIQQLCRHVYY